MEKMNGKKILITGCSGFIGSHVVDAFLDAGAEVFGFIHYNGHNDTGLLDSIVLNHIRFHPIKGDILDENAVDKAVEGMDAVVHMAAIISIPFSYENPNLTSQVNVMGTLNVLNACLKHKIKRLVVTSTSEVYGSSDNLPITEEHPLKPQSPYSASKIGADALAKSFYCSYGLPVIILRPFNCYGPRQSDRAIIPTVISQALSNKESIEVGALHTKRDFVFATDAARAFVLAASVNEELNGQTVHFGTGKSYSVLEMVDIVRAKVGTSKGIVVKPYRLRPNASEVTHLLSDASKAKHLLKWEPLVSFEEGIDQTIDYIKKNPQRYTPGTYSK